MKLSARYHELRALSAGTVDECVMQALDEFETQLQERLEYIEGALSDLFEAEAEPECPCAECRRGRFEVN